MASKSKDPTDIESLARAVPLSVRWIMGISVAGLLATGAVAVFASSSGPGTAALTKVRIAR